MATGRNLPLLPLQDILSNRLGSQAAEIEQLVTDNHQLASTLVALRLDIAAVHEETEKVREFVRSIRTESGIQIRVILDKMAKKEGDIQPSDSIRRDLQHSFNEAQKLVTMNQELSAKIKHATEELKKARLEVKELPEKHDELEKLQQEHQRLRKIFEYEKGLNIAKVEQMKVLETDMVGKAKEMERLQAEVLNAERRAQAINSYGQSYMYPTPLPVHGSMTYMDGYGRPQGAIPYGSAGTGVEGAAVAPNSARGPEPY